MQQTLCKASTRHLFRGKISLHKMATSGVDATGRSMELLFDTHCHAHDDFAHIQDILRLEIGALVLMGTNEQDW